MTARYASLAALLALVVGASFLAGSFEAGEWYYQKLSRPAWTPPAVLFALAWATFYLLLALAAWQVWASGHYERMRALAWWLLLLLLAVGWSWLFFGFNLIGWSWLALGAALVVNLLCLRAFLPLSRQGALLLTPAFVWLLFLWALNLVMWSSNGGFLGRWLAAS